MIDNSLTKANGRDQQRISIYFAIDGERIPYDRFGSTPEQLLVKQTADMVREEIKLVKCPVHHKHASTVTFTSLGGDDYLSYTVNGCCETLVNRVEHQLR